MPKHQGHAQSKRKDTPRVRIVECSQNPILSEMGMSGFLRGYNRSK